MARRSAENLGNVVLVTATDPPEEGSCCVCAAWAKDTPA
jgi:hypothetical protein